jgi:ankyrin repeat protein
MDMAWAMYQSYSSQSGNSTENAAKRNRLYSLFSKFDWEGYCDDQNYSKLHRIILGLHSGDLSDAVQTARWTINDTDSCGRTALMWAILKNDPQSTEILLLNDANPEIKDMDGETPLHQACSSATDTQCLELLLRYGANYESTHDFQKTPIFVAANKSARALEILLKHGANGNVVGDGARTPLHHAAAFDQVDCIAILLQHGSDINARDSNGLSPLELAVVLSRPKAAKFLLELGAETISNDGTRRSILHTVAKYGSAEIIRTLTQNQQLIKLDMAARDSYGRTARDWLAHRHDDAPPEIQEVWDKFELTLSKSQNEKLV